MVTEQVSQVQKLLLIHVSLAAFFQLLSQAFQVGVHIVKAVVFGQVHQHSRRTAAFSGPAEAAVTDPSAWWALPLRIQQSISDLFSVAVTETRAAELTPDTHALWITAVSFGVDCLLAALVASGSSGAVVDFLSHIVADALQLHLCDVLHRPHYMGDGLASSEGSATGRFINFLIVATFANQAELVVKLFLWRWARRSIHQGAGPCVGPRRTLWVSPAGSRGSHGPPRCLSGRS